MIATNNKTLYLLGGKNEYEKAALYTYGTFYLLAALAGNSVILLATSRRYKAIKLDRVTVTVIQHIAFCDVGNVFVSCIPGLISFICQRWVWGRVICLIRVYIGVLFGLAGSLLVCGLNVSKLSTLLNPLGIRHVPTTTAKCHLVVSFLWLVAAIWPVSQLAVDPEDYYFDYRVMVCMYAYSAPVWKWLGPLCLTVVIILPSIIVIATTLWLLMLARKNVSKRNKRNNYGPRIPWSPCSGKVFWLSFWLQLCIVYLFSLTVFTTYSHLRTPISLLRRNSCFFLPERCSSKNTVWMDFPCKALFTIDSLPLETSCWPSITLQTSLSTTFQWLVFESLSTVKSKVSFVWKVMGMTDGVMTRS